MSLARPLGAKLFLEGYEVPLIGATITYSVDQASIAYVDIVPHATANYIKPRTHVVIAVRDYMNAAGGYPYVVAWEGEVFGISFGKSAGSRSLSLQCIDFTGYWDNAMMYFTNFAVNGGAGISDLSQIGMDLNDATKNGIGQQTIATTVADFFGRKFDEAIKDGKGDFLDAFVSMYKDLTAVNSYFKAAEKRYLITKRFRIKSSGALKDMIEEQSAKAWLSQHVDGLGGLQTVRMVVQNLMSLIFHDFTAVPFPSFSSKAKRAAEVSSAVAVETVSTAFVSELQPLNTIPSTVGPTTPEAAAAAKKASDESAAKDEKIKVDAQATVGSYIFKPNLHMCSPPMCNIFFPEEYSSFQFSRNFFQEPTRLIYKPEHPLVGQSKDTIHLSHVFQPDAFNDYMFNDGRDLAAGKYSGKGDFQVAMTPKPPGYGQVLPDGGKSRMPNFLTNEELLKGIWLSQESAAPSSSALSGTIAGGLKNQFLSKVSNYLLHKKRYQNRSLQITSHLKLSVMPGFPVLVLDDSDTQQNIIAYCDSVTHRIFAQEGGYTSVTLSYARLVGEQANASEGIDEPIYPPWFDPNIFGTNTISNADGSVRAGGTGALSGYYKELIGTKGYVALNEYFKLAGKKAPQGQEGPATPAKALPVDVAVDRLRSDYRSAKRRGPAIVQQYIASVTSRAYTSVLDAFGFLGATTSSKDVRETGSFVEFNKGPYTSEDESIAAGIQVRRKAAKKYRDAMKSSRGSNG